MKSTGIALICVAVVALTGAQLLIKTTLAAHGAVPFGPADFLRYLWSLLFDWRAWAGASAIIVAATLWYTAVSRLPLSVAFPFGAMSYPLVFLGSVLVLREQFSWMAVAGNALIVGGVMLVAASAAGH